ncbi:hypothetical protein [Fictibacillus sp. NRS-1165]
MDEHTLSILFKDCHYSLRLLYPHPSQAHSIEEKHIMGHTGARP